MLITSHVCTYAQCISSHSAHNNMADTQKHKLILAMEYCPEGQYSICHDEIKQYYRSLDPHFIIMSHDTLKNNYRTVFTLSNNNSDYNYEHIQQFNTIKKELHSMTSPANLFSIYSSDFKKRVHRSTFHGGKRSRFNGKIYYALFLVEFTCVYVSEQSYDIPLLRSKNKRRLIESVNAERYHICAIKSISPASSDEYLKVLMLKNIW